MNKQTIETLAAIMLIATIFVFGFSFVFHYNGWFAIVPFFVYLVIALSAQAYREYRIAQFDRRYVRDLDKERDSE